MKLDVIGISGKAGSGKDTCANLVFEPRGYRRWAFAWPLKMDALGHGFTHEEVFVTKPPRCRQWMQEYGTDHWRGQDPDHWVKMTDGWLRTLYAAHGMRQVVLTDVRFPNECEYVRSLSGKLIRMEHGFGMPYALEGTAAAVHASETALDDWTDWDAVVRNDFSGHPMVNLQLALAKAGIISAMGGR